MSKPRDSMLELATLPELKRERFALLDKICSDSASVKELRRFQMLTGLIANFEQAKLIAAPLRKVDQISRAFLGRAKKPTITAINPDCDICAFSKATVFSTSVRDGKLHKDNFCEACAVRVSEQDKDNPLARLMSQ